MARLYAYLTFNGNCREAMTFYKKCFGGTLRCQTLGTKQKKKEPTLANVIVHAQLKSRNIVLQGTDLIDEGPLQRGNNVSFMVECSSERELDLYFKKLSHKGEKKCEPVLMKRGNRLASIVDQFGMQWLLNYQRVSGR